MADPRHMLGQRAERAVADWLVASGWRLLAARWRVLEGELDLVCIDPAATLVGIEVRARRSGRSGSAIESLSEAHLRRLRAALQRYAREAAPPHAALRLDLVTVVPAGDGWRLTRLPAVDRW